jgi:hypothetical protein
MKTNQNNPICYYCRKNSIGKLFVSPGDYIYYCEDCEKNAYDELFGIEEKEKKLELQKIKNSATFLETNNILAGGISCCIIMVFFIKYYYAVPVSLNWKLIIPSIMYVFAVLIWNAVSLRRKLENGVEIIN